MAGVLQKSKPPPSNLLPLLCSAVKSLGKRDDILILPADKGRATISIAMMPKFCLLKDDQTYKELDKDHTPSMERKLNVLLLQLRKKGAFPVDLYNKLHSSGGLTPLLYGLPKKA